jgi:hypothetical protein
MHLNEMAQCPSRGEQLSLDIRALRGTTAVLVMGRSLANSGKNSPSVQEVATNVVRETQVPPNTHISFDTWPDDSRHNARTFV